MIKVLIVDDEVEVARALRRTLTRHGFDVAVAHGGAEGLPLLETFVPDIVISDFRMPGMSGAEFLAETRQRLPRAIRFVLSGYADLDQVLPSQKPELRCRFLRKPWDTVDLVATLRDAVAEEQGGAERR